VRISQNIYGIYPHHWPFIAESRHLSSVDAVELDDMWEGGWRHFGTQFFRSSLMVDEMALKRQVALRIALDEYHPSKSQRRTMRRNADLEHRFGLCRPGREERALFDLHKARFARNVPNDLSEFLGDRPDLRPNPTLQLSVRLDGRLVAASFLNTGRCSCSSVYAVFDLSESRRRLGIYTMLLELEYARKRGLKYYYSGYATMEPSCYDYKKDFSGLSFYDWSGDWRLVEELVP
jgi:arginine-tRNA-protein transferase